MTTDEDGTIRYKLNGLNHRTDGPAVIAPDGRQWWYLNGLTHRTDGPAIIWSDGHQYWYLNGKQYRFNDYFKQLKQMNIPDEDIVCLKLKYDPLKSEFKS